MKDFIISLVLKLGVLFNAFLAAHMIDKEEIVAGAVFSLISLVIVDIYAEYKKL